MSLATIAGAGLTAELKPQVGLLVDDMRERLTGDVEKFDGWRAAHREAVAQEVTAGSFTDWVEDQLTQAAVGWLLTSVFVRFCEDNLLLGESGVWITHADPRLRQRALDEENAFYQGDPDRSYREWLEVAFAALRSNRATAPLVDEHAAIGIISPSSDAVHQLVSFWRRTDDDGNLVWRFDDDELSTRFLGDLYQDLSEYAKKKYALLQTPVFVEEFILEQTLIPALKDRPLEGFKVIDPTCGSGHFLLGAFEILVDRWHREAPGLEVRARVNKALESVHGVDVNPFATAIAMFRLIVAALKQTGDRSLVNAPAFTLNLASGDSLLHGPDALGRTGFDYGDESFDKDAVVSRFSYRTEDVPKLRKILTPGQYDVVVGNPPYITVKDKALNARYREIYHYCKGKYALTVPFMERFFQLAKPGERAGWVGQITSNSFMKREFGAPIIEQFLSGRDLRLVADTSGAYIPGHGTPTVIIVGRNYPAVHDTVRAVLGIQSEPGVPNVAAEGHVWTSIVEHVSQQHYENKWISVTDLPRELIAKHPWSLEGGGASTVLAAIEASAKSRVSIAARRVGVFGIMGADSAMVIPLQTVHRHSLEISACRRLVIGEQIRDFTVSPGDWAWFPYTEEHELLGLGLFPGWDRWLWPFRTELGNRSTFSGGTYFSDGRPWYEWHQLPREDRRSISTIAYAFVATHNHFVLVENNDAFNQSAPIINLSTVSGEASALSTLGALNSSTIAFWLRQNSYNNGRPGANIAGADEPWEHRYQFNGSTVGEVPLVNDGLQEQMKSIATLAEQLIAAEPHAVIVARGIAELAGAGARAQHETVQGELVAAAEELDWAVYHHYGLMEDRLLAPAGETLAIASGERAFAVALARRACSGDVQTSWFAHHNHQFTPTTELPAHWPAEYRALVGRRLEAIEANPIIRVLETPEHKRRWAGETWAVKLERTLRNWLLDKLEDRSFWFTAQGTPQPLSVGELAGHVEKDPEFITALDLWAGQKDAPVTRALEKLLADQVVPYLAAMRYKDSGLRKRAEWEHVWSLQRDEDAGLIKAADIPVPPKYTGTDFVKQSYWSQRGKLDVPKERFTVYPGAGRATDPTPLLGWAGWNHAQQGIALATIYAQREAEGAALSELVPLVAGIAELLPWVKQWHSGIDPVFNIDLAEYLTAQLAEKSAAVGVPISDLPEWRPPTTTRRKKK